MTNTNTPISIDLKKDRGLTIAWADGSSSYYSVVYLRRMSPSADMRQLRDEMAKNPLTVLSPAAGNTGAGGAGGGGGASLVVRDASLVGNYAIQFSFSDGHTSGIYSWEYLRQIDPAAGRQETDRPDGLDMP